jgi:hypothetical protein
MDEADRRQFAGAVSDLRRLCLSVGCCSRVLANLLALLAGKDVATLAAVCLRASDALAQRLTARRFFERTREGRA